MLQQYLRELCGTASSIARSLLRRLNDAFSPSAHMSKQNIVALDHLCAGARVTISNFTVGGQGSVIANCGLHQGRSYWEVRVVEWAEDARLSVGLCTKQLPGAFYDTSPLTSTDGSVWVCTFGEQTIQVKPGDLIGMSFDQSDVPRLSISLNSNRVHDTVVRGAGSLLYPVFGVNGGAKAHVNFGPDKFDASGGCPTGFSGIIKAVDLV